MKKAECVDGLQFANLREPTKKSSRDIVSCDACCMAKRARVTIPRSTSARATEVGENVHFDICGPVGAETLGGSRYFILFKDEFSNFRSIHMMESRSEAYDIIRANVNWMKIEAKRDFRRFTSDNGSEFTSHRTQAFFKEQNIIHATSAPNYPQQNRYIERDNRTIMKSVRSILFAKNMPETYWGEAASVSVYI